MFSLLAFFDEFCHFLDLQQKGQFKKFGTHIYSIKEPKVFQNSFYFFPIYFQMNICISVHCGALPAKAFDLIVARSEFSMVSDRSFFMPRNVNGASSDKSR